MMASTAYSGLHGLNHESPLGGENSSNVGLLESYTTVSARNTGKRPRSTSFAPVPWWALSRRSASSYRTVAIVTGCVLVLLTLVKLSRPLDPEPWVHQEEYWKPADTPRKALILGSYTNQTVTWMQDIPADWEIYRYINDDPAAEYTTPTKTGNEAIAYLTFINDHYDDLPDYMIFLHGHDRGWHQPEHTVQKIRALNLTALRDEGYISLRCANRPGCTAETAIHIKHPHSNPQDERWMQDVLPGFLEWMFPEIKETPEFLSAPCCAQFATTKGQVRRRSKEWWEKYRYPLLHNIRLLSRWYWRAPAPGVSTYMAGVVYEKTYHLALGKPPAFCPEEDLCRKTFFSDAIHCDRYTAGFHFSKGWQNITCTDTLEPHIEHYAQSRIKKRPKQSKKKAS